MSYLASLDGYMPCEFSMTSKWIELLVDRDTFMWLVGSLQISIQHYPDVLHWCSFVCLRTFCTSIFVANSYESEHHFEAGVDPASKLKGGDFNNIW